MLVNWSMFPFMFADTCFLHVSLYMHMGHTVISFLSLLLVLKFHCERWAWPSKMSHVVFIWKGNVSQSIGQTICADQLALHFALQTKQKWALLLLWTKKLNDRFEARGKRSMKSSTICLFAKKTPNTWKQHPDVPAPLLILHFGMSALLFGALCSSSPDWI